MLTVEQRLANKVEFVELLSKLNVDLTRLMTYLESPRVDFFNKPYATYQGKAYEGSLCEHSLALFKELTRLCEVYGYTRYSEEDLIKVALFKNLYRAELFESTIKRAVGDDGVWRDVPAFKNKEIRPIFGDIGFSSYMIAKKFIDLSDDELVEAICYSSLSSSNTVDIYNIRTDYKLVSLTTIAELAVLYLGE